MSVKNVLPGSAGRLSGIDFSSNNFGGESVATAAAKFKADIAGQQYAFVKSTQGTDYKNPYFASQWKILGDKVKSGEMTMRVAYHYLNPGNGADGVAQAKAFLSSVGVKGKLPAGTRLALDWEGGALSTPGVLKSAADYIHKVTGQWPIVYTSTANEAAARAAVPDAPRWEANYGPSYRGINNQGGKDLPSKNDTFYQYSDGTGYGRPYDMNVYNGSLADLRKFAGFDGKTPAPKPTHHRPTKVNEPTLKEGATGAAVKKLQSLLDTNGCNCGGVDGDFGPHTLAAVKKFQKEHHLTANGVVGQKTWSALESGAEAKALAHDPVRRLNRDLSKMEDAFGAEKKAQNSLKTDGSTEKSELAKIESQKQAIIAQLQATPPPSAAQEAELLKQLSALGQQEVKTQDSFDAKLKTDRSEISADKKDAARWKKQALKDLVPAEYKMSLKETNKDRAELGLKGLKHPLRPPKPKGVGGTGAAAVARQYLGDTEHYLQYSGKLPMDRWVPLSEDCANFVSACLERAGKIPAGQHNDRVTGLRDNLLRDGWKETYSGSPRGIPLSKAKPGDVVCFDGPGGPFQHVEIFNGFVNGRPQFIGSNNILADGTQEISTDDGSWAYGVHVYAPPA